MSHSYSLAHLTTLGLAPPELTYAAAKAGYDYVSLRLIPLHTAGEPLYLPGDTAMIRRTRQALADTGVKLFDLELARILDDVDLKSYLPAMEVAAELGARHVITSCWTARKRNHAFHVESFHTLCELARPLGLTLDLEFPTFSSVPSLADAAQVVRDAGCSNGGILVDMLYIHYARVPLAELAALPPEWFRFAHLCDAPAFIPATRDGQIDIARGKRLYPGEGAIDIHGILATLPPVPLAIELPNTVRAAELGLEAYARECLMRSRQYLDSQAQPPTKRVAATG
jgi:sugar phosphate isomerase/epimerase